jgi:hypothetical protein
MHVPHPSISKRHTSILAGFVGNVVEMTTLAAVAAVTT